MGAGEFRVRIEFEQDVGGRDVTGQVVPDWQPFDPPLKRWGRPVPSRGRAYWAAWGVAQPLADVSGLYELPYDKTLLALLVADKSKIRGRIGERIFYIEAFSDPHERRKTIQLIVREAL